MKDILDNESWGFEPWITSTRRYDASAAIRSIGSDQINEVFKAMNRARKLGSSVAVAYFTNGTMLHAEADGGFTVTGHREDASDLTEFHDNFLRIFPKTEYREQLYSPTINLEKVLTV